MDISLDVFQKQIIWRLIFHMQVLRTVVPNVGYEPFNPQEEGLDL